MGKLNLKNIIIILIIIFMFLGLNNKYEKYKNILSENEIIAEQEKKKKEMQSDYEQIQILTGKLAALSLRNEADFKKMIYVFTKESGLKMKEISKSEKLWERNGYRLKYIHFTLFGGLNDFGKFLYYTNKSRKFIDTSKTYIELTGDNFKISLGFIERGE